jgi:hypothetical protein
MTKLSGKIGVSSITCLALILACSWVAPAYAKVQQNALLVYKVDGDPPNERLVLIEDESFESNCEQQRHPGCINVAKYYIGVIAFLLPGSNRECADGEDQWKLTSVRLGGASRLSKPLPKPETWGGLSDLDGTRAASDFGANRTTGETRYQKRKRFPDALHILDANFWLVSVWYQVTATHCSDPNRTATAEGRIDNRGQ